MVWTCVAIRSQSAGGCLGIQRTLQPSFYPHSVVWLSTNTVLDATAAGYRVIWSMDNTYYLDSLGEDWQTFYDQDIIAGITNATQTSHVIGGETAMWGETVVRRLFGGLT